MDSEKKASLFRGAFSLFRFMPSLFGANLMGGIITAEAARSIEQALQPRCRYLADFLAQANGPVSLWELVDRITPGSDDDGVVRTYICRIRAALGPDAIKTVRLVGYQLTEKGRAAYALMKG